MLKIKDFFSRRPHFIPAVIAAVMLLAALARWPYGYYVLLRWVVCASAIFVLLIGALYKNEEVWPFAVVGVLFNPLVPIHLTREIWAVLDVGAAVVFLASIPLLSVMKKDQEE